MIITRSEDSIVHHISVIDPVPCHHYTVCCKVHLPKPSPEKKETAYRNLKCIDFARFREDIRNLNLLNNDITSIADLVEPYNAKLTSLFDDHARVRNKVVTLRPKSPWFTPKIREQKMKRRRLERLWQKTRLAVDREIYTQQCKVVHRRPILQDPFSDACFEHSKVLFRQFIPVSEMQLEKLVTKFSRKSCDLDPIPATVLKECLHDLIPVITKLVNISFG